MFWGVTILPGRRYSQTVETSYHISKAVLEVDLEKSDEKKKQVQLMLEHGKSKYLLCHLDSEKNIQQDLDLIFTAEESITLYIKGEGTVHLSGYLLDFEDEDDDDDDDFDEEGLEDEIPDEAYLKRKILDKEDSSKKMKLNGSGVAKVTKNSDALAEDDEDDEDEEDDEEDALGDLDEMEMDEEDDEEEDEEDDEDDEEEVKTKISALKAGQQMGKKPQQQQQQQQQQKANGQMQKQNQQKPSFGGNQKPGGQGKFGHHQKHGHHGNKQQHHQKKGGFFTPDGNKASFHNKHKKFGRSSMA